MAVGPVEGSPIPLLGPHEPFAAESAAERGAAPERDAVTAVGDGFLDLVVQANARAHSALGMMQDISAGRSDDIHGTMIEVSKASVQTRLMVNVKDKVMEAFYEIWRMSV